MNYAAFSELKTMIEKIRNFLHNRYNVNEYPALDHQFRVWNSTKVLAGVRILDGTPVFANTLLKYINLLAAGAELTVGYSETIPYDRSVIDFLEEIGVPTTYNCSKVGAFDIILDCNAVYRDLHPAKGFAELTRSGAYHFDRALLPVINVDDSPIKAIETCLGTGESFLRAMQSLGYDIAGKNIVVIGCGKVGRGVVFYAGKAGANVLAVDDPAMLVKCINGTLISRFDRPRVLEALRNAWCVVTATGKADSLATESEYIDILLEGNKIIASMSVEDEWGSALPSERVLNNKEALNFILPEPTLLRYIDPTMALHNHAAVELLNNNYPSGLRKPDKSAHDEYWKIVEKDGIISDELCAAGL